MNRTVCILTAPAQSAPKHCGEKRLCERIVTRFSPASARAESSYNGAKMTALRTPLSTRSQKCPKKHLLGRRQTSASAPRLGGGAYSSQEPVIPRKVFIEDRENNPRQQIRPPPGKVRECHSHEPHTPREDRERCPRQKITPTTTKENCSKVITPRTPRTEKSSVF